MTLIHSVIIWIFLKASSCQPQCVIETLDDAEFSITVADNHTVEYGACIRIPYEFTFPRNNVTVPYKKIWFEGDPSNVVSTRVVREVKSEAKNTLVTTTPGRGEYEYGFKLEWGCNQTYIFPKRVQITVSALTRKPFVWAPRMTEGIAATLYCDASHLCSVRALIHWEWTTADGQTIVIENNRNRNFSRDRNRLRLTPTADDHNTNITCVAKYNYDVVNTTVTLDVKFAPKILNGSQCTVEGEVLVCVCISWGNPLSPITWPFANFTDYSVSSSSSIQTVNSTITMPANDDNKTSVKCISSNEVGQAVIEIPLQDYPKNSGLNPMLASTQKSDAVVPWIIVCVSLILNLVLLNTLIICAYKRSKSQQKEPGEEMNTYATLNLADVGQPYSVLSGQNR